MRLIFILYAALLTANDTAPQPRIVFDPPPTINSQPVETVGLYIGGDGSPSSVRPFEVFNGTLRKSYADEDSLYVFLVPDKGESTVLELLSQWSPSEWSGVRQGEASQHLAELFLPGRFLVLSVYEGGRFFHAFDLTQIGVRRQAVLVDERGHLLAVRTIGR